MADNVKWTPSIFGPKEPNLEVSDWPKDCDGALICVNKGQGIETVSVCCSWQVYKKEVDKLGAGIASVYVIPIKLAGNKLVVKAGLPGDKVGEWH